MWTKSGLIPKDVYRSMPIASTSLEVPGATMGKTPALDICEKLKQFLRYVDVYRSRWSFNDTEVVDVLLHFWRSAERVYGYLLLLEDLPDQMERAAQLLKVLHKDRHSWM
uniref:RxLR effector candidate protein n=1 Tax=Hyaloperonospora arabidopsidis (strain Emoy2) TaxID=559515 RepID=M4BE30_HYAAE